MRKIKLSTIALLGVSAIVASSCGKSSEPGRGPISFWHNFGNNYTNWLNESFIDPLLANDDLNVKQEGKGGYDGLLTELTMNLTSETYPNIATGYPDHFSKYARFGYPASIAGTLVNLDTYLNDSALNEAHRAKYGYSILEDYYPEYMKENQEISYDKDDNPITIGLPFNKSTEVMGYNGVFVDFVKANEATYGHVEVPKTWAEWQEYGPRFRKAQIDLVGNCLNGDQTPEGTASNFSITAAPTDRTLLDFREVEAAKSAVLSWDSMANMFITLVRQYGAEFTSYSAADRKSEKIADRHGYMEFWSGDYKAKTQEAMEMVLSLSGDTSDIYKTIFASPSTFGSSYSSDAFAKNKVLFTICSTGGLSYNINSGQRFRIAPVPYRDAEHKYVISQGANIAIFDQGCILSPGKYTAKEMADMSFEAIVKMTTGEYQAAFAAKTGYFPASKSATNSQTYQSFINGTPDYSDKIATAYREGAKLNETEYMNAANAWKKFVDPGFEGSAAIRKASESIVNACIANQKIEGGGTRTPVESIVYTLDGVYANSDLSKYIRK